ncbi:MAG: hypothetical protein M1275_00720 [Patescibacteria group bacterium]|nr:hypothetical protein [Patescibacteria group bacterium]
MPSNTNHIHPDREAELVKKDFFRSLVINGLFLLALVVLFFLNQRLGFLNWFINRF